MADTLHESTSVSRPYCHANTPHLRSSCRGVSPPQNHGYRLVMAGRGERAARQTMAAGGAIFGLSAVALIFAPDRFAEILGLISTDSVSWALRMLGFCLVPLVYTLFVVRGSMADHVVRSFSILMALVSLSLGIVTLSAPGPATLGRWVFALLGFGFTVIYLWAVFGKSVRRSSIRGSRTPRLKRPMQPRRPV